MTSSRDNVIRVLKFIDALLRNIKDFVEVVGAQQLFGMCIRKFIQTGRTPLTNSPRTLPDIKPMEHLDSSVSLPNFSILYNKYRKSAARWMLSTLFLAELFSADQRGDVLIGIVNSQHVRRVTLELFRQRTHVKS